MLIGNLTRDPELRYTPQGTAVCTMGLATNRSWVTENGDKKEETEFHRIVAWNKLAELCSQLLFKGRRVYVEGRLQTRQWTGQDGSQRQATEIVIEDMLVLDSRRQGEEGGNGGTYEEATPMVATPTEAETVVAPVASSPSPAVVEEKPAAKTTKAKKVETAEEVANDIPF
jgi:single-strand DNA-binding protein